MLQFFNALACKQLWFRTGSKDKLRFISICGLVESLGSDICASLTCFHTLAGCDSTSGLYTIEKKKAWMTLKKNLFIQGVPHWEMNCKLFSLELVVSRWSSLWLNFNRQPTRGPPHSDLLIKDISIIISPPFFFLGLLMKKHLLFETALGR